MKTYPHVRHIQLILNNISSDFGVKGDAKIKVYTQGMR